MDHQIKKLKKILLKPNVTLTIGDGILELNRFNSNYTIYEIEEFIEDGSYFYGKVVAASDRQLGQSVGCDIGAHILSNKSGVYLTYLLPNYRILFGK